MVTVKITFLFNPQGEGPLSVVLFLVPKNKLTPSVLKAVYIYQTGDNIVSTLIHRLSSGSVHTHNKSQ